VIDDVAVNGDQKAPVMIGSGRFCCSDEVVRGGAEPPTFRFSGVAITQLTRREL
jgi:hypothetical protein